MPHPHVVWTTRRTPTYNHTVSDYLRADTCNWLQRLMAWW